MYVYPKTISQISLLRIIAKVLERQDDYRRSIGQRELFTRNAVMGTIGSLIRIIAPVYLCVRHETKAAPLNCFDQALAFTIITKGLSRRINTCGNRPIGYDASAPDILNNIVARHNPSCILSQIADQIENLRL